MHDFLLEKQRYMSYMISVKISNDKCVKEFDRFLSDCDQDRLQIETVQIWSVKLRYIQPRKIQSCCEFMINDSEEFRRVREYVSLHAKNPMLEYINSYCGHFDVKRHIEDCKISVKKISQRYIRDSFDQIGQCIIDSRDPNEFLNIKVPTKCLKFVDVQLANSILEADVDIPEVLQQSVTSIKYYDIRYTYVKGETPSYSILREKTYELFPNVKSIKFGYFGVDSFMKNYVPELDYLKIFWKYPYTKKEIGLISTRDLPIICDGVVIFVSNKEVKVLQTQYAKITDYKKECFKYLSGWLITDGTIKITKAKDITEEYKLDLEVNKLISKLEKEKFSNSYYIIRQSDLTQNIINQANVTAVNDFSSIKTLKITFALDSDAKSSKLYEAMIDMFTKTNPNSDSVKIHLNITCNSKAEINFSKKLNAKILNTILLLSKLNITKLEVSIVPKVMKTIKADVRKSIYDAFSENCQIDYMNLRNIPNNWSHSVSSLKLRGLGLTRKCLKSWFLDFKRPPHSNHIRDLIDIDEDYLFDKN